MSIRTSVSFTSICDSQGRLPIRRGVTLGPPKSGSAPEGVFNRIVEKSLRRKARRRQAVAHVSQSLLLVDLSFCELQSELSHDYYRREFEDIIRRQQGLGGYDMLAFVDSPAWQRAVRMHFLAREDNRSKDFARILFPNLAAV